MSGFEHSTGGASGAALPPEMVRQQQVDYIRNLLQLHEEVDCPGAREVHVLYPPSLKVRLFEQWRLVDFHEPERLYLEQPQRQWVNGEQAAGWVIEGAAKLTYRSPDYYDPMYEPKKVLLLSDASYMTATGTPRWIEPEQENRLLVPDEYLQPLTPLDETLDLPLIAKTLWRILPAHVRQDTDGAF